MTKVVFQNRGYWLSVGFWEEAQESGIAPFSVERRDGVSLLFPLSARDIETRFSDRVGGWVFSLDKSVSVFIASLPPEKREKALQIVESAVKAGLMFLAAEFTARTGAQGRVRLGAEATFDAVAHPTAKDGSPGWHFHILIGPRVRVPGLDETYATHTRELYLKRKLFHSFVHHEIGRGLRAEFGVRVVQTKDGVRLVDVPRELCRLSSVRTQQIDDYLKQHRLPNTPISRRYAALATRRMNLDPEVGRKAFERDLVRTGFRPEAICRRTSQTPEVDANCPSVVRETRRVVRAARRLAKAEGLIRRDDLLVKALETAHPLTPADRVVFATGAVLQSAADYGIRVHSPGKQQKAESPPSVAAKKYATPETDRFWKKIVRQIDHFFGGERSLKPRTHSDPPKKPQPSNPSTRPVLPRPERETSEDATTKGPNPSASTRRDRHAMHGRERSTDWAKAVESILRSADVVGAVGHTAVLLVAAAVDLYRAYRRPVWVVDGRGERHTAGSVAALARDLRPLSWFESHKAAVTYMARLNANSLDERLRYGEHVYRRCRTRAKFQIPKDAVVVVQNVSAANPQDVAVVLQKVKAAKAKLFLADRHHTRSELYRIGQSIPRGGVGYDRPLDQSR